MNDETLKDLLKSADDGHVAPPLDLVGRVRQRQTVLARRRKTLLLAAPAAAAMVTFMAWQLLPSGQRPAEFIPRGGDLAEASAAEAPPEPISTHDSLAQLQAQADQCDRLAKEFIAGVRFEATAAMAGPAASDDPLDKLRERVEEIAGQMIARAEAKLSAMLPPTEALQIYRDVLRLFPASHGAQVARRRISELAPITGET